MMSLHKKIFAAVLSAAVVVLCGYIDGWNTLVVWNAAAQVPTETGNIFTATINLSAMIATVLQMLALLVFHFLQFFLDPLFILSINETDALRDIWKYSRDIVNVIFAFMLIAAGIYTVVTGQKELVQQKYKQFILAVILVNFSWFFPRVILDVANVLTTTIYQLPAGLSDNREVECKRPDGSDCRVITDVKYFSGCSKPEAATYTKFGVICYQEGPWSKTTNTAYGILNGLVINYAQLPELTRVINPSGPEAGGTAAERLEKTLMFLVHIVFVLVLMVMLFLPLAAMFVVFLIRIPIMWLTIAFMPFMFIGFVMGDKMGQFDTMKIFQHYVKAAFLPTVVAVPFAVGFTILTEFTQINCEDLTFINEATDFCKDTGPILQNVNSLWGLLILFVTFIVIWSGFWMALKIDDIYVNATAGIKSFGETIGKTALKLPLSIPLIPTSDPDKKMSILGVDDAVRGLSNKLSGGTPFNRLGGDNRSSERLAEVFTENSNDVVKELKDIGSRLGPTAKTSDYESKIREELGDETSKLSLALKERGIDRTSVNASDLIRKGSSGGNEDLRNLIRDMRSRDNAQNNNGNP